jgi:hypothetical protein
VPAGLTVALAADPSGDVAMLEVDEPPLSAVPVWPEGTLSAARPVAPGPPSRRPVPTEHAQHAAHTHRRPGTRRLTRREGAVRLTGGYRTGHVPAGHPLLLPRENGRPLDRHTVTPIHQQGWRRCRAAPSASAPAAAGSRTFLILWS